MIKHLKPKTKFEIFLCWFNLPIKEKFNFNFKLIIYNSLFSLLYLGINEMVIFVGNHQHLWWVHLMIIIFSINIYLMIHFSFKKYKKYNY